jgi:hypothetical protein
MFGGRRCSPQCARDGGHCNHTASLRIHALQTQASKQRRVMRCRPDGGDQTGYKQPVRLSFQPFIFSQSAVFFSYSKSVNSAFSRLFSAQANRLKILATARAC